MQLYWKWLQICYKKGLSKTLEVPKRIGRLQHNTLSQTLFFQILTQSKSSDKVFLTKIEDHN